MAISASQLLVAAKKYMCEEDVRFGSSRANHATGRAANLNDRLEELYIAPPKAQLESFFLLRL